MKKDLAHFKIHFYVAHPSTWGILRSTLFIFGIILFRYVLGAVETFLDAVPAAGFFQGIMIQNSNQHIYSWFDYKDISSID